MPCRLQIAISAVSQEFSNQQASKLLKPLMTAVDMVFGSAAALSATFGSKVRDLLEILISTDPWASLIAL